MDKCWCGNDKLITYSSEYMKCESCQSLISKKIFTDEVYSINNEEQELYGKNYWEIDMVKSANKNNLSEVIDLYISERAIYWLKYILKHFKLGGNVAEIGCGLGQLQYILKEIEYQQVGYELSPEICKYIRNMLSINMVSGEFAEETNKYNGIIAFDLIEHLINPLDLLKKIYNSLSENGVICIQTPCYNPEYTHSMICKKNIKFLEQLKEEQHIYLFSKDAIEKMLNEIGFKTILFYDAYFGNDYDMFLFAFKGERTDNSEAEIDHYLNQVKSGRIIKGLIDLFEREKKITDAYYIADQDRISRQEQIEELTALLKENEVDRANRQEQIEELTALLKENEVDRANRQEQIEELTALLKESEVDRANRQEQIEELTALLKESEVDRANRQEQIEELTALLKESEIDRNNRLIKMEELTALLKEREEIRNLSKNINKNKKRD